MASTCHMHDSVHIDRLTQCTMPTAALVDLRRRRLMKVLDNQVDRGSPLSCFCPKHAYIQPEAIKRIGYSPVVFR
jgi:hypothetical protein